MLVVFIISVDAYPFFVFSGLTCYLEDTRTGIFLFHCVIKAIKLRSSNLETSPSSS